MRRTCRRARGGFALCARIGCGQVESLTEIFASLSSGACVGLDEGRALGATVELTPEQFQFVRAFWMAIPPASRESPPGDKAFLAKDPNGMAISAFSTTAARSARPFRRQTGKSAL